MASIYVTATVSFTGLTLTTSHTNLKPTDILLGNFVITNNLFDGAGFAEDYFFDFTKSLSDLARTSDALSIDYAKLLTDASIIGDEQFYTFTKSLTDSLNVTDDLDGEASIEDDQSMVFLKKRSDYSLASDNIFVKSITKPL